MFARHWWAPLALFWLAGCGSSRPPANEASAPPATPGATDDIGRPVHLATVPQRIVTIGPGVTETLFALGAGGHLVGRDQISDYPPTKFPAGVGGVPVVGDYTGPFFEKVAAERPDLVIAQGETLDRARADTWQQKCGAPVTIVGAHTIEQVALDIEKIGQWTGAADASHRLAGTLRLANRAPQPGGPRAFFMVSRAPIWTAGAGTLVDDILRAGGCTNIAAKVKGYAQYNLETLAAGRPDIFITAEQKPDAAAMLRQLRSDPAVKDLECVRRGRVIVLHSDWVLRPGPRIVQGIAELQQAVRRSGRL